MIHQIKALSFIFIFVHTEIKCNVNNLLYILKSYFFTFVFQTGLSYLIYIIPTSSHISDIYLEENVSQDFISDLSFHFMFKKMCNFLSFSHYNCLNLIE